MVIRSVTSALSLFIATSFLLACAASKDTVGSLDRVDGPVAEIPPKIKCGSSVELSWTVPTTNADGSQLNDLAGIRIYYGQSSRAYSHMLEHTETSVSHRTLDGLAEGQYFFSATAFKVVNSQILESDYSREVSITLKDCTKAFYNLSTGQVEYESISNPL